MNKVEELQRKNAELRKQIGELRLSLQRSYENVEQLRNIAAAFQVELQSVNRILWAAAHAYGGRIVIPEISMRFSMDPNSSFEASRSPISRNIEIVASTNPIGEGNGEQKRVDSTNSERIGTPEKDGQKGDDIDGSNDPNKPE